MGFSRQECWSGLPFPSPKYWSAAAAAAKSLQSCPTLCDPRDTAAHQAPLSLGFSRQEHWSVCYFLLQCMKVKSENEVAQSSPTLHDPMDCSPSGSSVHGIFPGKSTGVGCHRLLQNTGLTGPKHFSSHQTSCRLPKSHLDWFTSQFILLLLLLYYET